MRLPFMMAFLTACAASLPPPQTQQASAFDWQSVEQEAFADARTQHRLVMLSIQADWCHWCHVMNETTYQDPRVTEVLRNHFVAWRTEADVRPDLADRYANFGWPATVFFDAAGEEVLALRGYRAPDVFLNILQTLVDNQNSGRALAAGLSDSVTTAAPDAQTQSIDEIYRLTLAQLDGFYDLEHEGWGVGQKYPFAAPVEHSLMRGRLGESIWGTRALATLTQHLALIDPVWGGMYQYSESGDWLHPHYEKIAAIQAGALKNFADAILISTEPRWAEAGNNIVRYLSERLTSPAGAFFASQDADLRLATRSMTGPEFYALGHEQRREAGMPHIDRRIFASVNGQLVEGLARFATATGDERCLRMALSAAAALAGLQDTDGLFRHQLDGDEDVRYLADQVAMARGFFALSQATGEAQWLTRARVLVASTEARLRAPNGALFAHSEIPGAVGTLAQRRTPITDNALLSELMLRLAALSHDDAQRDRATQILLAAGQPDDIRRLGRKVGEYLIALELVRHPPFVLTVVGPLVDETSALLRVVQTYPDFRRVIEVLPEDNTRYGYPGAPAIFMCESDACSLPVFSPTEFHGAADRFLESIGPGVLPE